MDNFCHIKYLNRSATNQTDKGIAWMYENCPGMMDATLIAANGQKVKAHSYVLCIFSKYFEEKCDEFPAGHAVELSLPNMSFEVVKNVVQLFYYREVFVPADLKKKMVEALQFLKAFDINVLEEEKLMAMKAAAAASLASPQKQAAKITQRRNTMATMPETLSKRKVAKPMVAEATSQGSDAGASGSTGQADTVDITGIKSKLSQLQIKMVEKKSNAKPATVPSQLKTQKKVVAKAAAQVKPKPVMPSGQPKQQQQAPSSHNGSKLVKANAAVQQSNEVKVIETAATAENETVDAEKQHGVETDTAFEQTDVQDLFPGQDLQDVLPGLGDEEQ